MYSSKIIYSLVVLLRHKVMNILVSFLNHSTVHLHKNIMLHIRNIYNLLVN